MNNKYLHYSTKYLHYSTSSTLTKSNLFDADIEKNTNEFKPNGLWLSEGDAWKEWCESEHFLLEKTKYVYTASFDTTTMITIDSFEKLVAFQEKYATKKIGKIKLIDWEKVCSEYDGIIFSDYFDSKTSVRNNIDYTWFLTIDVNSACIWRPSKVIKEFQKI